jgi:hypothetical protein
VCDRLRRYVKKAGNKAAARTTGTAMVDTKPTGGRKAEKVRRFCDGTGEEPDTQPEHCRGKDMAR